MTPPRKSLLRSLGEFFGHLRYGVKSDLRSRTEVRREVAEERRGNITLRRTIIEELEVRPPDQAPEMPPSQRDR